MPILEADFFTDLEVGGTPTAGANTLPPFDAGDVVYRKSQLNVAAATGNRDFDWEEWVVIDFVLFTKDFAGTIHFKDADGNIPLNTGTPNPDPASDGNRTVAWWAQIKSNTTSKTQTVVLADILGKADAKTYFAAQVALL